MEKVIKQVIPNKIRINNLFSWNTFEPVFRILVISIGVFIISIALKNDVFFSKKLFSIISNENTFIKYILFISGIILIFSIIFRTYFWFKYKIYSSEEISEWPSVTVIVPAYNEGENIYKTIESISASDYPREKFSIITIDDGSTDDTLQYIEKAERDFSDLLTAIKFKINRGKRLGIYEALKIIKSEYMISVDSDTILELDAIKKILTPMIQSSKIGAVTGRIKIRNNSVNIFTKMLNAHFAMAFDFTRAVQSTFSNVLCLSGAFSAYRTSLIKGIIEKWVNQKFLNQRCTYGEDRSLTNYILKSGFGTVYQREAVSLTIVPEKFTVIIKMLTRWARSNIRESIIFSGFMFNLKRKGNRILPFFEFFSIISLMIMHFFLFYYCMFSGLISGSFLFRSLAYSILFGFFYILYYLRIEKKRDFPYVLVFSLFSTIFMVWIFTVAAFTVTKKSWSTR